jgi:uncharacterized protein YdhG (YjbR/CyaY superfamily)
MGLMDLRHRNKVLFLRGFVLFRPDGQRETTLEKPAAITDYFHALAPDRKEPMERLLSIITARLPDGFEECINYGMPSWVVPHSIYEAGYHANPKLPLPFIGLASQKNHIAVYHMGIYASPTLMEWFVAEYPKHCKTKLDMGKSCIRFKKVNDIPYELIGELCQKMTPSDWTETYDKQIRGA